VDPSSPQINLANLPGHKSFIKSTTRGLSIADIGVLVFSCVNPEGFGQNSENKRHLVMARALNLSHLIVCLNKCDDQAFDEATFTTFAESARKLLVKVGFRDVPVIIPTSSIHGLNVYESGQSKMPWYHGPTLWGALQTAA
jgi:elongation factor 1-alpha